MYSSFVIADGVTITKDDKYSLLLPIKYALVQGREPDNGMPLKPWIW